MKDKKRLLKILEDEGEREKRTPEPGHTVLYDEQGEPYINIRWGAVDVKDTAERIGIEISDEEVEGVLRDMARHHDASLGINWDSIEMYIRDTVGTYE